jgi:UDP-N-acetylmuramoylalanine--D-glutamate ligase
LQQFDGLEHRIELVGTYGWIIRYNDAIATTPQATMAAIESFGEQVDTLFYGGIEGEYDHSWVAELIVKYDIQNLVLFPDTWSTLKELLTTNYTLHTTNVLHTRSMEQAVDRAAKHTKKWALALLSCGSPSFSCWTSFKEKGSLFKEFVTKL